MKVIVKSPLFLLLFFLSGILVEGCKKDRLDTYKRYLPDKEFNYAPKLDSFNIVSGKNRAAIEFFNPNERIREVKVFWNNGMDSIETSFSNDRNYFELNIPFLDDGNVIFTIYSFDKWGDKSVPSIGSVKIYGDNYQKLVKNRGVISAKINKNDDLVVHWDYSPKDAIKTIIRFNLVSGEKDSIIVNSDITRVANMDLSRPITYQTLFRPDSSFLDVFSSEIDTIYID